MGTRSSAKQSVARKQRQQVAAVCYRLLKDDIEFLLVQTSGGRWIFPKGGVEPGLTHAQSAALEALEEAGVHGRIEHLAFARYYRNRPAVLIRPDNDRSQELELAVGAHLCEVTRLDHPKETKRNPTWFPSDKAKRRLLKGRAPAFGAELARVVDRAASRIRRIHTARSSTHHAVDGLRRVRFESHEDLRLHAELQHAVMTRTLLREPLRLGAGGSSNAAPEKVTSIESGRKHPSPFRSDPSGKTRC